MTSSVRVRIAPSPTGNLHVGTARTALYNYLFARHHKGTFVMRLEDTDETRSKEAFTDDIFDGLKWLGLTWDEGPDIGGPYPPYRQTQKVDHYEKMARKLIASEKAYFCYCTPEEVNDLKNANPDGRYKEPCRNLTDEQMRKYESEGRTPAIRFKVEDGTVVSWHDGIKGEISIDSSDLGADMVIVKSSGMAIYNFAVVVDDIDMQITHVIRGEDHIHNTAKQLLIYEALGVKPPEFAHAALIFDSEHRKLSKRHHGELVHVDKYRSDGYMPEAIINYLAQMSWSPADGRELFSLEDACEMFDLNRVSKSPAVFDVARLNWFNSNYIRSLPIALIVERARPYLSGYNCLQYDNAQMEQMVGILREGLTTLSEITEAARFFFESKVQISDDLNQSLLGTETAQKVLRSVLAHMPEFTWGDAKACKAVVDGIGKELGIKGKDLYWPVRAALQGKTSGPDLGITLAILGEGRVRSRIEDALGLCSKA